MWQPGQSQGCNWIKCNHRECRRFRDDGIIGGSSVRNSWLLCPNKIMYKWLKEYTCPGFMVVQRKPWPCESEYYTICCSLLSVMFDIELAERKYDPRKRPVK